MSKILFESLENFNENKEKVLNEGHRFKKVLKDILEDPEKNGYKLNKIFKMQINMWPQVADIINGLTNEEQKDIAQDTLEVIIKNPRIRNLMLPIIKKSIESDDIILNPKGKVDGF